MAFGVCRQNISVNRFDYGVDIIWNLSNEDGTPFDVTGYEVQVIIKSDSYTPDEDAIFNQIVMGEGNSVSIPLEESLTSNPVGTYVYALRLIRNGSFVDTIIQGKFNIIDNVFNEAA